MIDPKVLEKHHLFKTFKLTVDKAKSFKRKKKLIEPGGYQDLCKIPMTMPSNDT